MSEIGAREATLHAYYDGELGWWARRRFEAQLRRSPELRAELEAIQSLGTALRASEDVTAVDGPDLWPSIAAQLPRSGAAAARPEPIQTPGSWTDWITWRPLATGALAAAAATVFFALQPDPPGEPAALVGPAGSITATVRYLDTGGRSVVLDGGEDFTIIWLTPSDAV